MAPRYVAHVSPLSWDNSDRRARLPRDWKQRAARIRKRDPYCKCRGCPKCSVAIDVGCDRPTTDVDHIVAGDNHADDNLQGLCRECHKHKTGAERPRVTMRRPSGQHPGLKG